MTEHAYSDYYNTAQEFGLNNPDFYAKIAHDFLDDEDAVSNKIAVYRKCIAN